MNQAKTNKNTNSLFKAIKSLTTTEELEKFFRDLCTLEELENMSERWAIAQLLAKGISYRKIAEELKTSTTTVSRVANWLNNGNGGYVLAIQKVKKFHHSLSISGKS